MFCFSRQKQVLRGADVRAGRTHGWTDGQCASSYLGLKKCLDGKHLHDLTLPLLLMSHILNQKRKVLLKGEIGTSIYAVGP